PVAGVPASAEVETASPGPAPSCAGAWACAASWAAVPVGSDPVSSARRAGVEVTASTSTAGLSSLGAVAAAGAGASAFGSGADVPVAVLWREPVEPFVRRVELVPADVEAPDDVRVLAELDAVRLFEPFAVLPRVALSFFPRRCAAAFAIPPAR